MAFAILGNPNPAFFDSSGSPLVSGTISVLDPADDTDKASYPTYDDAEAGTNANDNPITLDSRGECSLWGLDGEDYKIVLKDSNGSTIWTEDDVLCPLTELRYKITTDETSAGVTPTNYYYPPGDVRRYGAAGDGTSDDGAAIQRAINSNAVVTIPDGTYIIEASLNPAHSTQIIGSGYSCVLKAKDSLDAPVIQFSDTDLDYRGVTLKNFRIDGNKSNQTSSSASGIFLSNVTGSSNLLARHKLKELWILDCKGHGMHLGFAMRDSIISGIDIYNCDEYGFYGQAFSDSSLSNMNIAQSGKDNFYAVNCGRLNVSNVACWFGGRLDSVGNGFYVEDCGSFNGSCLTSQNNEGNGFLFKGDPDPLDGLMLSGCVADSDNKSDGGYSGMNLSNVNRANISLTVRNGNDNGDPEHGITIDRSTTGCEITITCDGQTTRAVNGFGIANNNVRVNGDPMHFTVFHDDFVGDVLADGWANATGSDPQVTAPAIVAGVAGGVCRLVTGDDAAASMAVNGVQLDSSLQWRANTYGVGFDCYIKLSAITNVAVFVGFTDQVGSLEMPFTLGASDTLTSNATDAVGFLFDTGADTDNWWAVGVDTDVDATKEDTESAPVAGTYQRLHFVLSNTGQATFFIDGVEVAGSMSDAVSSATELTPVVAAFSRGAASRNIDIDAILLKALRT